MENSITPATQEDLPVIFRLFEEAIQFQKKNGYIGWESMDRDFIKADVGRQLVFKVTNDDNVLGIFAICHNDELIWRWREQNDALYLHRIVLNRTHLRAKFFDTVLQWAIRHARASNKRFVRMDTWAENAKLINYYKGYGFQFIENYRTADTTDLPVQHRKLNVALLELDVAASG